MTDTAPSDCRIVVVGDPTDPRIAAVVRGLPASVTSVVDASSLERVVVRVDPEETVLLSLSGEEIVVRAGSACRGWVRRLAPTGGDFGVEIGSHKRPLHLVDSA